MTLRLQSLYPGLLCERLQPVEASGQRVQRGLGHNGASVTQTGFYRLRRLA